MKPIYYDGNDAHELHRRKLWCEVVVAVAGCEAANDKETPIAYADRAIEAFSERFPKPPLIIPTEMER